MPRLQIAPLQLSQTPDCISRIHPATPLQDARVTLVEPPLYRLNPLLNELIEEPSSQFLDFKDAYKQNKMIYAPLEHVSLWTPLS